MAKNAELRYKIGIVFLVLATVSPLLGLVAPFLNIPAGISALVASFFLIGAPKIFLLIGAALAGKEGVAALKRLFKRWFGDTWLNRPASRTRYNVGSVLFWGSLAINFLFQYAIMIWDMPMTNQTKLFITFGLDMTTIIGFFVLGTQFHEKVKALFTWEPPR